MIADLPPKYSDKVKINLFKELRFKFQLQFIRIVAAVILDAQKLI